MLRPDLGGDGKSVIDLTEALADQDNHCLLGEHGGFFLDWCAPQTYEIHAFILPEGRGPPAYQLIAETLEYMTDCGANHIFARILPTARHTRIFARQAGFKPCGSQIIDLGAGPVDYNLYHWRTACHLQLSAA